MKIPFLPYKKETVNKDIINGVHVNNHKHLIKEMENQLIKIQYNIEQNPNNKLNKKTTEALQKTLLQVFTNNTFMIKQLQTMNTIDPNNKNHLKRALENIKKLNIICDSIYMNGRC